MIKASPCERKQDQQAFVSDRRGKRRQVGGRYKRDEKVFVQGCVAKA